MSKKSSAVSGPQCSLQSLYASTQAELTPTTGRMSSSAVSKHVLRTRSAKSQTHSDLKNSGTDSRVCDTMAVHAG